jgi:hypothetical protein
VESLSQALLTIQKAKDAPIEKRRRYLEALREYCERAADLISQADYFAPGAAKTLRRGLPIINRNIEATLKEIEADSARLLDATKKTPFKLLAIRADERLRYISRTKFRFDAESILDDVVPDIRIMCSFLPERSNESVCELRNWERLGFEDKLPLFKRAITLCANQMVNLSEQIGEKNDQIAYLREAVLARLDTINFHIFKINIRSGDMFQNLRVLEYELQKIRKIKEDLDRLGQKLDGFDIHRQQALRELRESAPGLIMEMEEIIKGHDFREPVKQEVPASWRQELLSRLQALKASPAGATLDLAAALSSIISLILTIHPLPH